MCICCIFCANTFHNNNNKNILEVEKSQTKIHPKKMVRIQFWLESTMKDIYEFQVEKKTKKKKRKKSTMWNCGKSFDSNTNIWAFRVSSTLQATTDNCYTLRNVFLIRSPNKITSSNRSFAYRWYRLLFSKQTTTKNT